MLENGQNPVGDFAQFPEGSKVCIVNLCTRKDWSDAINKHILHPTDPNLYTMGLENWRKPSSITMEDYAKDVGQEEVHM